MNKRKGNWFAIGVLLSLGSAGLAQTPHGQAEPALELTIRVYNYALVPSRTLARAYTTAATIFSRAGINTEWVDCPLSEQEWLKRPVCPQTQQPTDLIMRILPEAMTAPLGLSTDAFGFAVPSTRGRFGFVANVFHDRVAKVAGHDYPLTLLFGNVLAHEIGHLLLGVGSHAAAGIMRCPWKKKDLKNVSQGRLAFSPRQARRLRANVRARMGACQ